MFKKYKLMLVKYTIRTLGPSKSRERRKITAQTFIETISNTFSVLFQPDDATDWTERLKKILGPFHSMYEIESINQCVFNSKHKETCQKRAYRFTD